MDFGTTAILVVLGLMLLLFIGGVIFHAWQEAEDRRAHESEDDSEDS